MFVWYNKLYKIYNYLGWLSMKEIWVSVKGCEGLYEVSNFGNLRGLPRKVTQRNGHPYFVTGKDLKGSISPVTGYRVVSISDGETKKTKSVHRLVAMAFIPNPFDKPEVNHIDGNKQNNRVDKLEWVTSSENQTHAHEIGLQPEIFGESHPNSKLTEADVLKIREDYKNGKLQREIAEEFGICRQNVSDIVNFKLWKRVK